MTTWIRSDEAARLLGVSKPTLYAYVSRGLVERHTAPDGRTSLYARRDVDVLTSRARTRAPVDRPTIDAQVTSAVTALHDDVLLYRGRAADELARTATFEQVAELLWTGTLPASPPTWPLDRVALDRVAAVVAAARTHDPLLRLALAAATLADGADSDDDWRGAAPDAARRLLALAPTVLGGPRTGDLAGRLTRAWVRRPTDELVAAVGRALVLLADHELATSTLAVRVATSVRTDPYSALAVGLHTVRGTLHGGAAAHACALFTDAAEHGPAAAVAEPLDRRRRLSGFGHSIYRRGDPRVEPLLDAVRTYAAAADAAARRRLALAVEVRAEAMRVLGLHANVDFALATLYFVAGLPADVPLFAVARLAGWAAHAAEESTERPVRYRGLARPPA
jgi:citrate synthase